MKQVPSQFEQDVAMLSQHAAFARLLANIKAIREESIVQFHDVGTDRLQQLSGRILAYDDVLRMCNAEEVMARHRDAPV